MSDEVIHDKKNSNFFIEHNGKISRLRYRLKDNDTIEFLHTYVPKENRNSGIASRLAAEGLNYARENNLKVIPTCSFVNWFIKTNKEYEVLLL